MIHHGADRADVEALPFHRAHVDQQYRETVGALLYLVARRGAGQQQHQVGIFGARCPDFLAVDEVVVAVADCGGAQRQRVCARCRLGDAEGLQPQLAARDGRQVIALLCIAAVPQHRAHRVHLRMAGGAVAAGGVDFLHDRRGRTHRQAAAAILLRDQRREEAGLGQRFDECGGISALAIECAPVFAGEISAQRAHAVTDGGEIVGVVTHQFTSARPLLIATASRSTTRARKLTISPSRQISVRMVSPG